jgi:hypothetical protein
MSDLVALADIRTVDVDSHVTEPPDPWMLRVPNKWIDDVPKVELDGLNSYTRV